MSFENDLIPLLFLLACFTFIVLAAAVQEILYRRKRAKRFGKDSL